MSLQPLNSFSELSEVCEEYLFNYEDTPSRYINDLTISLSNTFFKSPRVLHLENYRILDANNKCFSTIKTDKQNRIISVDVRGHEQFSKHITGIFGGKKVDSSKLYSKFVLSSLRQISKNYNIIIKSTISCTILSDEFEIGITLNKPSYVMYLKSEDLGLEDLSFVKALLKEMIELFSNSYKESLLFNPRESAVDFCDYMDKLDFQPYDGIFCYTGYNDNFR